MSDIIYALRQRALQAEQDGEPIALLDEAAGEIEKLRSWVRIQDAVIHSGNVAALTEAEREAIESAAEAFEYDDGNLECGTIAATLRGLLERMSPPAP